MAKVSVGDVMTRRVVYLPEDTTVDEAAQAMRDQGIGDVVTQKLAIGSEKSAYVRGERIHGL